MWLMNAGSSIQIISHCFPSNLSVINAHQRTFLSNRLTVFLHRTTAAVKVLKLMLKQTFRTESLNQ